MDILNWVGEQPPKVASLAGRRQRDKRYRAMIGRYRKAGYSRLCSHQMANGLLDADDTNRKRSNR